jgi:hypothetical protein
MTGRNRWFAGIGAMALAVVLAGCSSSSISTPTTANGPKALTGTFRLTAGSNLSSGVTGSYFRMISPGGTIASGPYFSNPDSSATDKSYTFFTPGTAGGLVTGTYQPNPSPAFDAKGNALADSITTPETFAALKFSIATNATDPQSKQSVPKPSISVSNGKLTGQVEAVSAAWNDQYFNQGTPKPGGGTPGLTAPVSGTYDAATHAFVLTWSSQVVGGPFNGFTGYWHLQGTFTPAG